MVESFRKDIAVSLKGKCFISTRPVGKSNEIQVLLEKYEAKLFELPMIELSELDCDDTCSKILANYEAYSHIAFTSTFGFEFFCQKISRHHQFNTILSHIKIVSIGYKTSELIRSKGFDIALDANAKTGEEFACKLAEYLKGKNANVIWATGSLSPNILIEKVGKVSKITRINLYENTLPGIIDNKILEKIRANAYDMIIVASPSAFKNLYPLVQSKHLRVVCIGQTTANEVISYGIEPLAIANEPSSIGIKEAILNYYRSSE